MRKLLISTTVAVGLLASASANKAGAAEPGSAAALPAACAAAIPGCVAFGIMFLGAAYLVYDDIANHDGLSRKYAETAPGASYVIPRAAMDHAAEQVADYQQAIGAQTAVASAQ